MIRGFESHLGLSIAARQGGFSFLADVRRDPRESNLMDQRSIGSGIGQHASLHGKATAPKWIFQRPSDPPTATSERIQGLQFAVI
ncbi:MAG: hypothetical protein CMJ67_08510, partial [Planctomycetaceae bacterium]|nr:hypothetical protein [Planctomycetaceae bacterium]